MTHTHKGQAAKLTPLPSPEPEITDLVERYVTSARLGDSAVIAGSFLDDARIRGALEGAVVDRSAEEFLAFIDGSGPSPALKADLVWFDVVGTAAMIRLECRGWHGIHYTDFLSLVRRDGAWRIAGKVFFAHGRA